jgi:hydroxymethylglutaryl-CoA reductase
LKIIGVKGANLEHPGLNAENLARLICAAVMAGELSLLSALAGKRFKSKRFRPAGYQLTYFFI